MLAMFFLRMTAFIMAAYFAYVYARWVYAHLFNMFALYSFGSALESFGEVKVLFFSIFCGLGAALMHTGINYYYFNDALNTKWFFLRRSSSTLNQEK
jgi:hypothetical protein